MRERVEVEWVARWRVIAAAEWNEHHVGSAAIPRGVEWALHGLAILVRPERRPLVSFALPLRPEVLASMDMDEYIEQVAEPILLEEIERELGAARFAHAVVSLS